MANKAPVVRLIDPTNAEEPVYLLSTGRSAFTLLEGVEGFGLPEFEYKLADSPNGVGSVMQGQRVKEREIYLPLHIQGDNQEEVMRRWGRLQRVTNPGTGGCILEITPENRAPRTIPVLYKEGLQGNFGSSYRKFWYTMGLKLLALNPYWSGKTQTIVWQTQTNSKPFISGGAQAKTHKFFPVILDASAVATGKRIQINSDRPVYPIWSMTGPITDLKIQDATGRQLGFSGQIPPGDTLTIDTSTYGLSYVRGGAIQASDDSLYSRLGDNSEMFTLPQGESAIRVTGAGMTAQSRIELSYTPLYISGYEGA